MLSAGQTAALSELMPTLPKDSIDSAAFTRTPYGILLTVWYTDGGRTNYHISKEGTVTQLFLDEVSL